MSKYECGHEINQIMILDGNPLSMSEYLEWAEEENNLKTRKECFDCFLKRKREEK